MDLNTGRMLWLETYPTPPEYPQLQEDISCDVVIFGAGEAGALCAYVLAAQGVDTVLIEKRKVARGSSCANTGLLQFTNDMPLHQMIRIHGEDTAVRFYRLCAKAVDHLQVISETLLDETEFARRDSLYYASNKADVQLIKREYETLQRYGFPVTYLSKDQIRERFGFDKEAALLSQGDAEINPYRFAHALVRYAASSTVRVFEQTEVTSFAFKGEMPTYRTTQGHLIQAKRAVFCMGYETQAIEPTPGAVLSSTYVIATEPLPHFPHWSERCLIWETARPYLYLRTTADQRVIVGGLDMDASEGPKRDQIIYQQTEHLREEMIRLFPALDRVKVDYRWASTFASSQDGLPFIGKHPKYPNCYLNLGYGGNGMIYYTIAAKIMTDLILHGSSSEGAFLQPNRLHWSRKIQHTFQKVFH